MTSNKRRFYLILLLLTWILGCLFQYLWCCKQPIQTTVAHLPVLNITGFKPQTSITENITFPLNNANPNPISDSVKTTFSEVKTYLANHPDKALAISGYYLSNETSVTDTANLGMARAQALQSWLVEQQIDQQQITLTAQQVESFTGTDDHYIASAFSLVDKPNSQTTTAIIAPSIDTDDHSNQISNNAVANEISSEQRGFVVKSKALDLTSHDNFNFISGDYIAIQPISDELTEQLETLTSYLNQSPSRQLTITGFYHPDEDNPSIFSSLGLARANYIKNYLFFLGANSRQITIQDKADTHAVANQNQQYLGMAAFTIDELNNEALSARKQQMQALATTINAKPLTLYFDSGDAAINLNQQQRDELVQIIRYLGFDNDAKASITGHTDNTGNRENNVQLGKERAAFAAEALIKKGLSRQKVIIDSVGPDQPIADNETPEGRAKNRRVVITIKQTQSL